MRLLLLLGLSTGTRIIIRVTSRRQFPLERSFHQTLGTAENLNTENDKYSDLLENEEIKFKAGELGNDDFVTAHLDDVRCGWGHRIFFYWGQLW